MPDSKFFLYLLVMAGTTYLIRAIPFAALNKQIKNKYLKSFLHYIPFTVLSAMIFPAAFFATGSYISAAVGVAVSFVLGFSKKSLLTVAAVGCFAVFLTELFIF